MTQRAPLPSDNEEKDLEDEARSSSRANLTAETEIPLAASESWHDMTGSLLDQPNNIWASGPALQEAFANLSEHECNREDIPGRSSVQDGESDEAENTLNDVESVTLGRVLTNKGQREYTIILVGETGTGKTCFLSLLANILAGNSPSKYQVFNDKSNEAGGSQKHSQTHEARLYTFKSTNGIVVRILDTPGLADTRGMAQHQIHKASIAQAIGQDITDVTAVIILANGTVPRVGVATDYAIASLCSIFPHTLTKNIGYLFTNVSSPLSWNFEMESLPEVLQGCEHFLLDNPLAMKDNLHRSVTKKKYSKKELAEREQETEIAHRKAARILADLFDWLNKLEPQSTEAILLLHNRLLSIDSAISNALSRMNQAVLDKKDLEAIRKASNGIKLTMKQYQNYTRIISKPGYVQVTTDRHHTLCNVPDCHSNCHSPCNMTFTLDPLHLAGCRAFGGFFFWNRTITCQVCLHDLADHRHFNCVWKLEDTVQVITDQTAEKLYKDAEKDNTENDLSIAKLEGDIQKKGQAVETGMEEIATLTHEYAQLSLSGSFAGQISKSVRLLEQYLERMQRETTDANHIGRMEQSLTDMKLKLKLVQDAQQLKLKKPSVFRRAITGTKNIVSNIRLDFEVDPFGFDEPEGNYDDNRLRIDWH